MLRRSHKKSRGGCLTCKARHAKCDERRPICTICKISHRACTYDTQQSQTYPRLESSDVQNDGSPSVAEKDTFEDIPSININHMELLFHLTETKNLPCLSLADDAFTNPSLISLGIKLGFMFPFLLHEFLAFSALHLACTGRENNQFQFHQAMALQTRAVSLFNSSFADVNESNCVPILLFSSVLGQHFLTNTLAERHPGGLDAFLSKYIHCVEIHRGIHVIAMQYWPQLMESELAPILAASSQFTSRTPKGNTCRKISELITGSQALSVDEKEACNSVIQHLQVGFDAVLEGEEKERV
ncbi:hypothetical protein N7478_003616 [Penicillium angulare]|uniref:uncharacterized protein n=1 Tax=Penicillium angulare TaxID=116970 RepID=UPI0025425ED7|nr:uncharacterized protein N7478_003616 [Penicillium angulare]KAJ5287930.1 hypothetical protein N7478_003616 [Penicillium angulare]